MKIPACHQSIPHLLTFLHQVYHLQGVTPLLSENHLPHPRDTSLHEGTSHPVDVCPREERPTISDIYLHGGTSSTEMCPPGVTTPLQTCYCPALTWAEPHLQGVSWAVEEICPRGVAIEWDLCPPEGVYIIKAHGAWGRTYRQSLYPWPRRQRVNLK